MTLQVLIVDDEPLALERLRVAFAEIPHTQIVGAASDGEAAADAIAELQPDVVILDVQMPGQSGMAVARALDGAQRPEVIFVTAFDHYAAQAFDVEAADYLLKPVKFDRLKVAVERARRRIGLRAAEGEIANLQCEVETLRGEADPATAQGPYDEALWAPTRKGMVRVPVGDIDWIEAARDYVLLHTATRSHIVRVRMSQLEQRLDPEIMLRVHRSAFVRRSAVVGVERPGKGQLALRLSDGAAVQVGPNYSTAVVQALGLAAR